MSATKHILITGGTGFIGQHLVPALLRQGWRVSVLTRDARKVARLFRGAVGAVQDINELNADATPITAVVNLAGARILGKPWTKKRKQVLLNSRVQTTQRIVRWMEGLAPEQRPKVLISASAIGYYGVQPAGNDAELNEQSAPQSIFMSELCQQWERVALQVQELGVKVALSRLGVVLGNGGALPMMALPIKLFFGGKLGRGDQWLSWVHVDDVVQAMLFLLQQSKQQSAEDFNGAYNLTAPQPVQQLTFARTAAGLLKRPAVLPTPAFPMRLLLGEQSDLLLEGQRVVPARLEDAGFTFTYPDLKSALTAIWS